MQMFHSCGDTVLCISALVIFALGVSALPVEEKETPDPIVSLMAQTSANDHSPNGVLEAEAHGIVDVDTTTQPPVVNPSFDSSQWLPDPYNQFGNYVKRVGWRCTPVYGHPGGTWSHNSIGPVYRDCSANRPGPCLGFSRQDHGGSLASAQSFTVTDLSSCVQDWRFTTYLKSSSLPGERTPLAA